MFLNVWFRDLSVVLFSTYSYQHYCTYVTTPHTNVWCWYSNLGTGTDTVATAYHQDFVHMPAELFAVFLRYYNIIVRPDQINLLFHGFACHIFSYSGKQLSAHAQLATLPEKLPE